MGAAAGRAVPFCVILEIPIPITKYIDIVPLLITTPKIDRTRFKARGDSMRYNVVPHQSISPPLTYVPWVVDMFIFRCL